MSKCETNSCRSNNETICCLWRAKNMTQKKQYGTAYILNMN